MGSLRRKIMTALPEISRQLDELHEEHLDLKKMLAMVPCEQCKGICELCKAKGKPCKSPCYKRGRHKRSECSRCDGWGTVELFSAVTSEASLSSRASLSSTAEVSEESRAATEPPVGDSASEKTLDSAPATPPPEPLKRFNTFQSTMEI